MMKKPQNFTDQMNSLGKKKEPFVFLIDFLGNHPKIFSVKDANEKILWKTPNSSNVPAVKNTSQLKIWKTNPVSFKKYDEGFTLIQKHIHNGDSYLLNYTQPTPIETNLKLEDIFFLSSARYKVLLKEKFVCFSPEPFVKIVDGKISSYPMKGTMNAGLPNSKELILRDSKELAEHNTIVDLIRNDLSLVAKNVKVDNFRYLDRIKTKQCDLWQVSSKISGELPEDYTNKLGDIVFTMLPAGSISGAPKKKTIEIILEAEKYNRGYYTGIFGYFDGKNLDSCVLIRYIEKQNKQLVYKSGGGITFMSDAKSEYNELLSKVYVPEK